MADKKIEELPLLPESDFDPINDLVVVQQPGGGTFRAPANHLASAIVTSTEGIEEAARPQMVFERNMQPGNMFYSNYKLSDNSGSYSGTAKAVNPDKTYTIINLGFHGHPGRDMTYGQRVLTVHVGLEIPVYNSLGVRSYDIPYAGVISSTKARIANEVTVKFFIYNGNLRCYTEGTLDTYGNFSILLLES